MLTATERPRDNALSSPLGSQFDALKQVMAQKNPFNFGPQGPECADVYDASCAGSCDQISEQVQYAAHEVGLHPIPGRVVLTGSATRGDHVVAVHKGYVIDYTLRQFEPTADVPHVEPIKSYMASRGYTAMARD